jgi:hypothetical protein
MGLVQYASVYPDQEAARAALMGEASV